MAQQRMVRGNSRWLALGIIAAVIVVADQVTKCLVESSVPLNTGFDVVPGFLNLVHVRNPGAAFGIGSTSGWDFRRLFFVLVSVAAVAGIIWIVEATEAMDWALTLGYSLFVGGALGNLLDRIRIGEVIDFLDFYWGTVHWPAFNVADSALCVGVGCFFWHVLVSSRHTARLSPSD
jgi:signal peptidase II